MPELERAAIADGVVDVLVIGGGMAGLAVAAELGRQASLSVAVLEAGPDHGGQHIRSAHAPHEATRLWLYPETDPDFWRPYRTVGPAYQTLAGLRRRVGGRSLYWGGVLLPIEPWALADGWPTSVAADLTSQWDGGPGLYERVIDDVVRWGAEPLTGPSLEVGGLMFDRTPQAVRRETHGRWRAFSPLDWWDEEDGDPAVRRVPILSGHVAAGILIERGRAVGARVHTSGGTKDLRASRVVLAASTFENSRLALQALAAVYASAPRELPGLADKIAQGFTYTFRDPSRLSAAIRAAAREGRPYHRLGTAQTRSNHFVSFAETAAGSITLDSWMMGEQQRGQESRVVCEDVGQWPWRTTVHARLGPADHTLRVAQQQILNRFWAATAEAAGIPDAPLSFAADHGSVDLAERLTASLPVPLTYSFPLGAEQHEAGTTAFGEFLDEDQQFLDVSGMYACGPSTFPRTGAANPSMTTLALAKRLGAILAR